MTGKKLFDQLVAQMLYLRKLKRNNFRKGFTLA